MVSREEYLRTKHLSEEAAARYLQVSVQEIRTVRENGNKKQKVVLDKQLIVKGSIEWLAWYHAMNPITGRHD